METLVNGLVDQTDRALQQGSYEHRVVLADGKREIWRTVDEFGVFDGFTRILDFYHAAQHLSKAAEHLFGKRSGKPIAGIDDGATNCAMSRVPFRA